MVGKYDDQRRTSLINAVRNRKYDSAQRLLQTGALVDEQDREGKTALHYATQSGFCVDILLGAKANVNISDVDGNTPLLLACAEGRCRIIKLLCQNGADVNICNSVETLPITLIAQKGHVECAAVLVHYGATVHKTEKWVNLLRSAVKYDRYDMIKYILSITGGDLISDQLVCEELYSLVNDSGIHEFISTLLAIGINRGRLRGVNESVDLNLSNPLQLKQCCRVVVRSRLRTPVLSSIHRQLYLPSSLGLYLALQQ